MTSRTVYSWLVRWWPKGGVFGEMEVFVSEEAATAHAVAKRLEGCEVRMMDYHQMEQWDERASNDRHR